MTDFDLYLVSGASGFLGRAVIAELLKNQCKVRALVLENDPLSTLLPPDIEIIYGNVCDHESLERFFARTGKKTCVIHCAGIISIASKSSDNIYRVNVGGTNNIIHYCENHSVGKLVYVSSVHAFPDRPAWDIINEDSPLSPSLVSGAYAKSKAIATTLVFEAAGRGLNASVVFLSGLIGPEDEGKGPMTSMLISYLSGKLPLAVNGGYDFVDVRDAARGILLCAASGQPGKGYILSGHYISVRELLMTARSIARIKYKPLFLPLFAARLAAPVVEKICLRQNKPLYFTPYSVEVLGSNGKFSHHAATACFDYSPRPAAESIRDMVQWIHQSTHPNYV